MQVLSPVRTKNPAPGWSSLPSASAQDVRAGLPLRLLPGGLLRPLLLAPRAGPRGAGLPLAFGGRGLLRLRPAADTSQAVVRVRSSCFK